MMNSGQAQEVAAAALEEAKVIGVIDDAGEVGVLVIDAQRQQMLTAVDAARVGCVVLNLCSSWSR